MKDIKDDPDFVEGMEAFLMGHWEKAQKSFLSLESHFPDNEHVIFICGNIFYSLGELDKAVEYFKKTIKMSENCGNAYYKLGVTYFKMGKFSKALSSFKLSTKVSSSHHAMVNYYMGLISMHMGKDREAVEYFDKLRARSPQTKMASFFEAQLKVKNHDFETAIDLLEEFLEVSPDFAEAHFLMGESYLGLHKNYKALNYYRKAHKMNPEDKRCSLKIDMLSNTDWP